MEQSKTIDTLEMYQVVRSLILRFETIILLFALDVFLLLFLLYDDNGTRPLVV